VELLVVIAIISVLAAMLLPALEGALESARRVRCLNRQKQIYLALTAYAHDYDDILPAHPGRYCMSGNGYANIHNYSTATFLWDYVCNGQWPKTGVEGLRAALSTGRYDASGGLGNWRQDGLWVCHGAKAFDYSPSFCPNAEGTVSRSGRMGYFWPGLSLNTGASCKPPGATPYWLRLSQVGVAYKGSPKILVSEGAVVRPRSSLNLPDVSIPYTRHKAPDGLAAGQNVLAGDGSAAWRHRSELFCCDTINYGWGHPYGYYHLHDIFNGHDPEGRWRWDMKPYY
jgi:type II secretory pathway pseudopilin PulG